MKEGSRGGTGPQPLSEDPGLWPETPGAKGRRPTAGFLRLLPMDGLLWGLPRALQSVGGSVPDLHPLADGCTPLSLSGKHQKCLQTLSHVPRGTKFTPPLAETHSCKGWRGPEGHRGRGHGAGRGSAFSPEDPAGVRREERCWGERTRRGGRWRVGALTPRPLDTILQVVVFARLKRQRSNATPLLWDKGPAVRQSSDSHQVLESGPSCLPRWGPATTGPCCCHRL